jgi:hypothetical protein
MATGRIPDSQERAVLLQAAQEALADYRQHRGEAAALLNVGASRSDPKLTRLNSRPGPPWPASS